MPVNRGEITRLLDRLDRGDEGALEELLPKLYEELRALAARYMRRERAGHTLQPTALVHEAYLRLFGESTAPFAGRAHVLAAAARAMRQLLIEHARRRGRQKRGGGLKRVDLELADAAIRVDADLLALDSALEKLGKEQPRKAQVVELLYFGGLTAEEAGEVLGVTSRTVERDWRVARLWLLRELKDTAGTVIKSRA